jgi:hypothetical protein
LVASSGPSPVRGFIAAIECSLHMSQPASAGVRIYPYCSLSAAFGVQRPGYARRDGGSATGGTQQSAMWSSTIPVACINA